MGDAHHDTHGGGLGFLDSLASLFRPRPADAAPAQTAAPDRFAALEARFDAAVRDLEAQIEARRRAADAAAPGAEAHRRSVAEVAAEREARIASARASLREDIERMHARLGTGLASADLDELAARLGELDAIEKAGRTAHALVPRMQGAIAARLHAEAGELAVARVVALLERRGLSLPDPTRPPPGATPEEVDRARRWRLADLRRAFLADDFARTADAMRGIVKGWGADYPERGSPLWDGSVVEGVAAGLRGSLLREFVDALRRDRDALLREVEAALGEPLAALQTAVAGRGVHSLEEAGTAVAAALRALDEVVPSLAWEHLRARLPAARGEAP